jgi:hypothetical protein
MTQLKLHANQADRLPASAAHQPKAQTGRNWKHVCYKVPGERRETGKANHHSQYVGLINIFLWWNRLT